MKTIKNTITEYKSPKCKVVNIHVAESLLGGSFGTDSIQQGNTNWWDDDENE